MTLPAPNNGQKTYCRYRKCSEEPKLTTYVAFSCHIQKYYDDEPPIRALVNKYFLISFIHAITNRTMKVKLVNVN